MKKTVILNSIQSGKNLKYKYSPEDEAEKVIRFIKRVSFLALAGVVLTLIASLIW
jgi:hypothetical protein